MHTEVSSPNFKSRKKGIKNSRGEQEWIRNWSRMMEEKPMGRIRARKERSWSFREIYRPRDGYACSEGEPTLFHRSCHIAIRPPPLRPYDAARLRYALRISGRNIAGGGRFGVTKERILNSEKPTGDICIVCWLNWSTFNLSNVRNLHLWRDL